MVNFLSFSFWLYFLYFIVSIIVAFYIPGRVLIKRLHLPTFPATVLSFLVGMVFWGWQGFIFGYLGIRWFSYIYLSAFLFLWIQIEGKNLITVRTINTILSKKKIDLLLVFIFLFGILFQLTSVWFAGVLTQKGLYFCCGNNEDNILQIAITDQIVKHFPPIEPGMYPIIIQNYHYWDSLVMGELIRVFKLPLIATDYQYMTIFISFFLGLSALVFSDLLKIGKVFNRWLIFFLYFGGDLVWLLITIFRGRDFFSMTALESGPQFLENIPRAVAVIVFFAFASLFLLWLHKKDKYLGFLMAVTAASLVGFKIYIGIFVLCGLGALGLYYLFKKEFHALIPLVLILILSLLIYLPVNSSAGGFYFTGFWRFENFIVQPYLGGLNRLELARVIYSQHNSYVRVAEYELIYIAIFIFAVFGTKLLGFFQNKKSLSLLPKELNILLFTGIFVSAIVGLFFNQTTGGSNTFNFLVSIFIIGSIYTSLACYYWLHNSNKIINVLLVCIIILCTIPRGIDQAYNNISNIKNHKGFLITNNELMTLRFLSKQKQSFVLVDPQISMDLQSPYISFLSNQKMFLSGQTDELEAHGINFSNRLKARDIIFGDNTASISAYLLRYNIGYIYTYADNNIILKSTESAYFLQPIYKNKVIEIFGVDMKKAQDYYRKYYSLTRPQ